jgi:hypothetical protein
LVLNLHTPFSFIGPYTFLKSFIHYVFSNTASFSVMDHVSHSCLVSCVNSILMTDIVLGRCTL